MRLGDRVFDPEVFEEITRRISVVKPIPGRSIGYKEDLGCEGLSWRIACTVTQADLYSEIQCFRNLLGREVEMDEFYDTADWKGLKVTADETSTEYRLMNAELMVAVDKATKAVIRFYRNEGTPASPSWVLYGYLDLLNSDWSTTPNPAVKSVQFSADGSTWKDRFYEASGKRRFSHRGFMRLSWESDANYWRWAVSLEDGKFHVLIEFAQSTSYTYRWRFIPGTGLADRLSAEISGVMQTWTVTTDPINMESLTFPLLTLYRSQTGCRIVAVNPLNKPTNVGLSLVEGNVNWVKFTRSSFAVVLSVEDGSTTNFLTDNGAERLRWKAKLANVKYSPSDVVKGPKMWEITTGAPTVLSTDFASEKLEYFAFNRYANFVDGSSPAAIYTLASGDYRYVSAASSTTLVVSDPYGVHNVMFIGELTVTRHAGAPTLASLAFELTEVQIS
ncbi:MAG: hypothetical protein QXJ75_05685 [Candidatus Bathyarchaeia archaeon]